MAIQDENLQNLEFSIDELFQRIQPDLDELEKDDQAIEDRASQQFGELFFEKERDEIMMKRYQLDQFKRQFLIKKNERGRRMSPSRSGKKRRGMTGLTNLNLSANTSRARNSLSSRGSNLSFYLNDANKSFENP